MLIYNNCRNSYPKAVRDFSLYHSSATLSGHKCILFWILLITHKCVPSVRTSYIRHFTSYSKAFNLLTHSCCRHSCPKAVRRFSPFHFSKYFFSMQVYTVLYTVKYTYDLILSVRACYCTFIIYRVEHF